MVPLLLFSVCKSISERQTQLFFSADSYLNKYHPGGKKNTLTVLLLPLLERDKSIKKYLKNRGLRIFVLNITIPFRYLQFHQTVLNLHVINITALLLQVSDQSLEQCNLLIHHSYPNLVPPDAIQCPLLFLVVG